MSNTKVIRPILPVAPEEYDPAYMNQLARTLEVLINEVRNPLTGINGLPDQNALSSLEVGDVYQDSVTLKIKVEGDV